MDAEPDSAGPSDAGSLERLLLAGIGWLVLGAEAADGLADEVARRAGIEPGRARTAVRDALSSWRSDADSVISRRGEAGDRLISRLGLVRRGELDELELRLAQLEHRLRLLEQQDATPSRS